MREVAYGVLPEVIRGAPHVATEAFSYLAKAVSDGEWHVR